MTTQELPDHVRRNRAAWDEWAPEYVAEGEVSWRQQPGEETWGICLTAGPTAPRLNQHVFPES